MRMGEGEQAGREREGPVQVLLCPQASEQELLCRFSLQAVLGRRCAHVPLLWGQ